MFKGWWGMLFAFSYPEFVGLFNLQKVEISQNESELREAGVGESAEVIHLNEREKFIHLYEWRD